MPTLIPDFYLVQSCLSTFQFNKKNIPNVCQGFVLLNIYVYIYKYSLPITCIQNLKVHHEFTTQSLTFMILMIYHSKCTTQHVLFVFQKILLPLGIGKTNDFGIIVETTEDLPQFVIFPRRSCPPGWLAEVWFGCYILIHFEHNIKKHDL